MLKSRIVRVIIRLKDTKYIKFGFKHFVNKLSMDSQLATLKAYHEDESADFENIKKKKLSGILKYASKNSSYYKELFIDNSIDLNHIEENWDKIPFLDKKLIRNNINSILVMDPSKDYVNYVTTGGSTGEPLGFYLTGGYDAEHQKFLYEIMGYSEGDKILAMDGTLVPKDLVRQQIFWVEKSENDLPYGSVALSSHYLTNDNTDKYLRFINDFKPSIIRGYPAFINTIASFILKNSIKLEFSLKGIELTSESFTISQVENIKKAFQTKVYNQYGHAEASVFGYSVDESLITYCSPLYGFTEVIGENNLHVSPGEVGEIVVTGFDNYAMPFIRYKTGDLALYDGEDRGIVRLKKVYGRTQDFIFTKRMEKVLLTALVFGRHYNAFKNIEKWQIVQDVSGEITFKIIKGLNYSKKDEDELSLNFLEIAEIKTKFEYVATLPLTARGKSKFLIQNILL